jgi:hypothetical protein
VSAFYGLFYVLTAIFACGNPAKLADALLGSKKCLPTAFILSTGYLYGALNVIADWTFVLIPISVLLDSALDRRAKISVSVVMALGAVGSVSSIMRMVYLRGLILSPTSLSSISDHLGDGRTRHGYRRGVHCHLAPADPRHHHVGEITRGVAQRVEGGRRGYDCVDVAGGEEA